MTHIRIGYGILLLLTLLSFLPHRRRFFLCEKWGGYIDNGGLQSFNSPQIYPIVLSIWFGASILMIVDQFTIWALLINLLFCRYYFIQLRWKSLARGMGAPGYITYWLGSALFFLEFTSHFAPSLFALTLLIIQVDFACIFFLAGFYKFKAGYRHGMGMELGLANPQWGYFWSWIKKTRPSHFLHRLNNFLAWSMEMLAAICFVIPSFKVFGGILLIATFIYIASCIRLSFLSEMAMLIGCLCFIPGSVANPSVDFSPILTSILQVCLWTYLCLLPFAYGGLCYNFYLKKSLPQKLQTLLERYTNFFGMILWRVFSVDVTNFFIQIYREIDQQRILVSRWGWNRDLRWGHVCEAITVTCVFTALKYYAKNRSIFDERIRRYAKTIPHQPGEKIIFEYINVEKAELEFVFKPIREFRVNTETGLVEERVLDPSSLSTSTSPVHEGVRPGSYVPLNP